MVKCHSEQTQSSLRTKAMDIEYDSRHSICEQRRLQGVILWIGRVFEFQTYVRHGNLQRPCSTSHLTCILGHLWLASRSVLRPTWFCPCSQTPALLHFHIQIRIRRRGRRCGKGFRANKTRAEETQTKTNRIAVKKETEVFTPMSDSSYIRDSKKL